MKRFTIGVFAFLFAMTSFAQNVEVEEVWNQSARANGAVDPITEEWMDGAVPDWMGNLTERGMTQFDGKVYIPSRNEGNKILVLDGQTGLLTNTIVLPAEVTGGTFAINSISVTTSGDLILGNLATNTQAVEEGTENPIGHFKVYQIKLNATGDNYESITEIIKWENVGDEAYPAFRLGDAISFFGDISEGANGYLLAAGANTAFVLKWDVTGGVVATDPVIIKLATSFPAPAEGTDVNLQTAPHTFPINASLFMVCGKDLMPAIYNMDGEMITTFNGEVMPLQGNGNGAVHFQLNSRDFLVTNSTVWNKDPMNAFELFEVPGADFAAADSIAMLPADGLGAASNASFVYPVSVDVMADMVYVYVMAPNNGIACYKVSIGTGTAIGENAADEVVIYPNPATEVLNFSQEMASVKVYDMSGKFVKEFTGVTQVNVSDLRGYYVIVATDIQGNTLKTKVLVK